MDRDNVTTTPTDSIAARIIDFWTCELQLNFSPNHQADIDSSRYDRSGPLAREIILNAVRRCYGANTPQHQFGELNDCDMWVLPLHAYFEAGAKCVYHVMSWFPRRTDNVPSANSFSGIFEA